VRIPHQTDLRRRIGRANNLRLGERGTSGALSKARLFKTNPPGLQHMSLQASRCPAPALAPSTPFVKIGRSRNDFLNNWWNSPTLTLYNSGARNPRSN
jgi:hypothetical protein